jgi:uncharacterized membrane protein YciS (DUF1049 family)
MLIIAGLVILLAAVVVGVTGVAHNAGAAHLLTDHFAVFNYHVSGSTGTVFLYGIVVGAVAGVGLCVLLAGAQRAAARGRAARLALDEARHDTDTVTHDPGTGLGDGEHVRAGTKAPMAAQQVSTTGRRRFPLGFPPLGRWAHRSGEGHHPADTKPTSATPSQ